MKGFKTGLKRLLCLVLTVAMVIPSIPVTAAEQTNTDVVIDALDYGADPTGMNDSAEAIQAALEAAKEASENGTKSVTLNFPKGEYHIYKDKSATREYHTSNTNSIENPVKTIGILIEEQKNLTIEGNGSLFMMHGNMMALAVAKSENITLHDFAWDFAVPTVSEMTVVGMGTEGGYQYTDFYIPECFNYEISGTTIKWMSELSPYTGKTYWTKTGIHENAYSIVVHQPEDEMTRIYGTDNANNPFAGVSSIKQMENNTVRITYSSGRKTNQELGHVFQFHSGGTRETAGAFTWESKNVTAQNVNVHFMHGFGWLVQMSENVYYRDCNFMPRENSGHLAVSYADGIHASGAKGDFVIENCNFAHAEDDPINMHGTFTRVEQRIDDHTLKLVYVHSQQGGFPQFHEGDIVQFFTRDTLESTDGETEYTVAEVVSNPGEDGNNLRTMVIRFEETLPTNLSDTTGGQPKYVAENVSYAPSVTIKGCTFKNISTRGILCTTRNKVVIEDNIFYPSSMASIFLSNDSNDWYESGPIRDMTIRNNTFYVKDIGGKTSWTYASAIYIHPVTKGGGLPDASNPIHKNITIEGNTFYMDEDTVVKAESVENLKFINNTVLRMNPDVSIAISLPQTNIGVDENAVLNVNATGNTNNQNIDNVFDFTKSKDVLIEGNTYDDGLKLYAVDRNSGNINLDIRDEEITIVTSESKAPTDPVQDLVYVSSDPSVAVVDERGVITGKKAGTADIFAYYMWNGSMIRSNTVAVTVTGESETPGETAETITITGNNNVEIDLAEANTYSFAVEEEGKEVSWSVVDFETKAATDAATISADGVLTANKPGIVWVNAVSGTASDRKAVVITGEISEGLTAGFEIEREDEANYKMQADSVEIAMQTGDLWQSSNTVNNLILYNPTVAKDNLRTTVKVDGLPIKESGQWDTASFILYNGDDNYVTVGKKSHFDGFATVVETSGTAVETGADSAHNSVTSAYLGFTVKDGTITVDYKLDGGEWTKVREITGAPIGDDYQIGMACWHTNARGNKVTFSDFRVGTADTAYDELPAVAFMNSSAERPTVSNVDLTAEDTTVTVSYTYDETNTKAEGSSLYRFTYVKDGKAVTTISNSKELTVEEGVTGVVSCQVYPVNALGNPGTPSAIVTAAFAADGLIAGDDNVEVKAGETYTFTLVDEEAAVTWSVADFETNGATDVAAISEAGVLTANKPGIVWVTATAGDVTDTKAVVISGVTDAGTADGFSITREDDTKYNLQADSVEITMQAGDLWEGSNTLKNLFLYNPTIAKDNLRTVIKVEGLPINESGQWDTASFILYKDDNNYVTIGKKSHYAGFATVVETNGSAPEQGGDTADNAVTTAYLGFTKVGNTISMDAKVEGGEWKQVREITTSPIGDDYKIGFGCWHSNDRGKKVTFSEFHVGAADTTTYESLCAEAPMTLLKQNLNRPEVSNVQLTTDGTNAAVSYQFTDADGDAEGRSLYRFTYEKDGVETTVISTEKSISAVGVDEITCQVYPVDQYGNPGTPSDVKSTSFTAESTAELYSITVNGQTVYTRGGAKDIDLLIPAEASKMVLSYVSVNDNIGTTTISKNGEAISGAYGNSGEVILNVANNDTITIVRGENTYTIKVATVESNNTDLASIVIEGLEFNETSFNDSYYYMNAASDQRNLKLAVTKTEECGKVEILAGDYRAEMDETKDGQTYTVDLTLKNGLNTYYVKAIGKDGISETQYILAITYMPSSEVVVNSLTVDGKALAGFDADTYTYFYEMALDADSLAVAIDAEPADHVRISFNGTVVDGAEATFTEFKEGENTLVVAAGAPDGIGVKRYTITVIKPYESNTDLQSLTFNNNEISAELSTDETNTVYAIEDEVPLNIVTQDSRAVITVKQGNETILTGTGSVSGTIKAYSNANVFTVEITAADGTSKESYEIAVEKAVYLSDIDWASAQNGWGSLGRNVSCEGNPIRLPGASGEKVTFEKGLGTHADSIVVYNVAGKGYKALQGYAGIDCEVNGSSESSVQFTITIDGTVVFDSGVMGSGTPMMEFNIEIPEDAQTVTLKADKGSHNGNDHADWADAKFVGSFEEKPGETPDPEPVLETISVKTQPTKKTYTEGETFDPAGLVITLNYSDGTKEEVAYKGTTADNFSFRPSLTTALAATDTYVVVTYAEKTANIGITVEEAVVPGCTHTNKEVLPAVEPTCTEKGLTAGEKCADCGEILKAQTEVAAKGHTEVVDAAVAATCTEAGKTEGKHCSVCNTVLAAQKEVPATGHTWSEWTVVKEATVEEEGRKERKCSVCNAEEIVVIPKLPSTTPEEPTVPEVDKTEDKAEVQSKAYNSVSLKWDAVANAESYMVEVYASVNTETLIATYNDVTATNLTVSGLKASTEYTFKIYAVNKAGVSEDAMEVTVTTKAASSASGTPDAPTTPSTPAAPATGDNAQILTWIAVTFVMAAGTGVTFFKRRKVK